MSWPTGYAPFSDNRTPILMGLASSTTTYGNAQIVPVAVDDVTGALLVETTNSGTVTANQGTPNTISNAWPVEITNGTNVIGVSGSPIYTAPQIANTVSTGNSTTTQLGAGATFTGAWENVLAYSSITVTAITDQVSASNGAVIQFSPDGSTITRQSFTTVNPVPTYGLSFSFNREEKYFRLLYTNGSTATTTLNISTIYSLATASPTLVPLGANITANDLAALMRSIDQGETPSGGYSPIQLDSSNNLQVNINSATADVPIKALTGGFTQQFTINTTAVALTTQVTGVRKDVSLKALPANTANIFIGFTSGVTTSTGYPLAAGDVIDLELTTAQPIYAISASSGQTLAMLELQQ